MAMTRPRLLPVVACVSQALQPAAAFALPTGGVVSAGEASIAQSAGVVEVSQSSNRAVIDWQSFDVGAAERVHFAQPGAAAIALNRVNGGSPSQVLGRLSANGHVWIVNPHGVLFGAGAVVNVGGLLASTANISNGNFMAGQYRFDQPGAADASVVNAGQITVAESGLAAFVAPEVRSSGQIVARLGRVTLAAGEAFTLDLYGDELIRLEASGAIAQHLLEHGGTIEADGGFVVLTAAAGQALVGSLINVTGDVSADTVGGTKGRILITAPTGGENTVMVAGSLSAQGLESGEAGGSIDVLGDRVAILSGAEMSASGNAGGGFIRIGGDYQGQGVTPTASRAIVQAGSTVFANALATGDGGRVIVWSDDRTDFAGRIEAKGGALAGDGGLVETSGKVILVATGLVDASSPWGSGGLWLLDPNNITINTTADANVSSSGASPVVWDTTNDSAVVTVASILTSLDAGTSVTIQTGTAGASSEAGNITVASDVGKTAGGEATLTLKAHNDITLNSNVDITSTSNKLNVVLHSDSDAAGGGSIILSSGSTVVSNGGNVTLGGGADVSTGYAQGTTGNPGRYGIYLNTATVNAGGGNIVMRGQGGTDAGGANQGIFVYDTDVTTSGSGTVTMTGVGGASAGSDNYGIHIRQAGVVETTGTGAITLTGTGGGAGASFYNIGVAISNNGAVVRSTAVGGGGITITGTGGTGSGGANYGVSIDGNSAEDRVSSVDGSISITGTGGTGGNSNNGIYLSANIVRASGGGNVTLTGTGNNGSSDGVRLESAGSEVRVATGNMAITATGASTGFNMQTSGKLTSTASGGITVTGTTSGSNSILIANGSNTVGGASATGAITLIGDSMSLSGLSVDTDGDVAVRPNTAGTTMGIGTGAGSLSLSSAELDLFDDFANLYLGDGSTGNMEINTNAAILDIGNVYFNSDGDITLSGTLTKTGGGNSSVTFRADDDILFSGSADITASGNTLDIVLNSDRDASGAGAISLASGTTLTSNGGNITLGGGANPATTAAIGSSGSLKEGIYLNGATLTGGGGAISLRGTAGNDAAGSNYGISATDTTIQTSGTGTISATGIGGTDGANNHGVYIVGASTLTTSGSGDITVTGTGGDSANGNANYGVYTSSVINAIHASGSGNITVTGTGGGPSGATQQNHGVRIAASSITASGGNISVTGTGGNSSSLSNVGIVVEGTNGAISTTGNGTISLSGAGRSTGASSNTNGINIISSAVVSTVDGDITVNAAGGNTGGGSSAGLSIVGGSILTNGIGNISITANGGSGGGSGVTINNTLNAIRALSSGTITIVATAGGAGGTGNTNMGVSMGSTSSITGNGGAISITGNGGASSGLSNRGIFISASQITNTGIGTITMTGTGAGAGASSGNVGVQITSSATVSAVNGAIQITGTGGTGSSGNNRGVELSSTSVVSSTGASAITLTGIGGTGGSNNHGIYTVTGSNVIGGGSATGDITFNADTISMANFAATTTANMYIQAYTGSTTVGVNGATGTLQVTSALLGAVSADTVTVGRSDGTGLVRIAGADLSAENYHLSFLTGSSNIQLDGGGTALSLAANKSFSTASASGSFTTSAAGDIVTSGTGDITIDDPMTLGGNLTLTSAGTVTFGGTVNGGYDLTASAGSFSFASAWGGVTPLAAVSLTSGNSLSLPSISAASVLARTTAAGADVTIPVGRTLTASGASTAITLAPADDFTNASASPFSLTGGGRWLVYSEAPGDNSLNGLTADFFRYSCTYGGSCPSFPGTGTGLLYSTTPTLTATPAGITLSYGDAVPNLAGYAYALSGYLGSDSGSDSVTGSLTGSTTYTQGSNVGSYNVNYGSGTLASALGYGFTYANDAAAITVNKKGLTAAVLDQTITYGDATPTLSKSNASHVTFTGLYGPDSGADLDTVTFSYGGASAGGVNNAGTYALSLSAFTDNNYSLTLPGGVTNGTLTIGKASLTVTADDATMTAGQPLPSFSAGYSGFVLGQTFATSGVAGAPSLATPATGSSPAGIYAIIAALGSLTSGNYAFSSFVDGVLTISAAQIGAGGNGAAVSGALEQMDAILGGFAPATRTPSHGWFVVDLPLATTTPLDALQPWPRLDQDRQVLFSPIAAGHDCSPTTAASPACGRR